MLLKILKSNGKCVMMTSFKLSHVLVCAAVLLLAACSTSEPEVSERIDVTNSADGVVASGEALDVPDLSGFDQEALPVESAPVVNEPAALSFELSDMSAGMSDGSVQIFSLDGEVSDFTPDQNVVADDGSVSLAAGFDGRAGLGGVDGMPVSDNVLIFPIDGVLAPGLNGVLPNMPMSNDSFSTPFPSQSANGFIEVGTGSAMEKIFFNFGSSRLGSLDLKRLDAVAQAYKANPNQMISVDGHASVKAQVSGKQTRQIVNLKESVNRAYKVARALIQRGVPAENIRLVAWGETKPPADAGQRSTEAAARRVEIRSLTSY